MSEKTWRNSREELLFGIYRAILKPLAVVFANGSTEKQKQKAKDEIASAEYKKFLFDFTLMAPSNVVEAYNQIIAISKPGEEQVRAFGDLLVRMRVSLDSKGYCSPGDMLSHVLNAEGIKEFMGKGEEQ